MVSCVDMSAQKQFGIRITHSLPQLVGTESFTRYELFPVSISKSVARRWLMSQYNVGIIRNFIGRIFSIKGPNLGGIVSTVA